MPELKLVINDPKTGKSYSKQQDVDLSGRKLGELVSGNVLGFNDFEFQITGGSDIAGFPMRKGIPGIVKKSALLSKGTGIKRSRKGVSLRKTVRGETIGQNMAQINLKITKHGKETIEKVLGIEVKPQEATKQEEKKE